MSQGTCPICNGRGVVPASFYGEGGDKPVRCRTCGGRQVVDVSEAAIHAGAGDDPMDLTGS